MKTPPLRKSFARSSGARAAVLLVGLSAVVSGCGDHGADAGGPARPSGRTASAAAAPGSAAAAPSAPVAPKPSAAPSLATPPEPSAAPSASGAAPPERSLEQACAELAAQSCGKAESCDHGFWLAWRYADTSACREAVAARCRDRLQAPDVAAGAAEVTACAAAIGEAACGAAVDALGERGGHGLPACRFKGRRPADAACGVDPQCESGICRRKTDTDSCGKCVAVVSPGDACSRFDGCDPDLACVDKKCVDKVAVGGDCRKNPYCARSACFNGKCTVPPGDGERCETDTEFTAQQCSTAYRCSPASKTCVPPKLVALGEPCDTGLYCANGYCDMARRRCSAWRQAGDACTNNDWDKCVEPFRCLDKKCVMPGTAACR